MLLRIVTGVVGIAFMTFIINTGGLPFAVFVLLLSLVGWWEYAAATAAGGKNSVHILGAVMLLLFWACAYWGNDTETVGLVTAAALLPLLATVLLRSRIAFDEACFSVVGILYIGLPFAHLVMLRNLEGENFLTSFGDFSPGCAFVWLMFIGTWASDTFAYFVGSAVGRHKLCPSISPNKTVEGFIGSLVGTTATIYGVGTFLSMPTFTSIVLGLLLAVFATLGDLVESVFKRHVGIKDSGNIIPGHGGVLDRFDSVLFTAPLVYYFAMIIVNAKINCV